MRKQNSLSYVTVRALFDVDAEGEDANSYFKVGGPQGPATIKVPTSVMHRLFRLGQAYGIRQLRYLEPDVKIVVGSVEIVDFLKDLRRVLELVNDEVLHHYVGQLVAEIEAGSGPKDKYVAVSTGNYFEKR